MGLLLASSFAPFVTATTASGEAGGTSDDFLVNLTSTYRTTFTSGGNSTPYNTSATAGFGVLDGATDGFESGLDALKPPAAPAPSVDSYFFYGSNPAGYTRLSRSIVDNSTGVTEWALRVIPDGDGGRVDLNWNAAEVAAIGSDYALHLIPDGNHCAAIDMRTASGHSYDVPEGMHAGIFTVRLTGPDAPRPDLALSTDLAATVLDTQALDISANVSNAGSATALCVSVTLSVDGTVVESLNLTGDIAAGAFSTVAFSTLPALEPGPHTIVLETRTMSADQVMADNRLEIPLFVAHFEPNVTADEGFRALTPGSTVSIPLTVMNRGNAADTILLALPAGSTGAWELAIAPTSLPLAVNASATAMLTAKYNATALPSGVSLDQILVNVTALSVNATALLGSATSETAVSFTAAEAPRAQMHLPSAYVPAGEVPLTVGFSRAMNTSALNVSVLRADGTFVADVAGAFDATGTLWTGSHNFTPGTDGSYRYAVSSATDTLGLELVPNETASFTVDTVAPTLSPLLTGPVGHDGWSRGTISVELAASDAHLGGVYYWVDETPDLEQLHANATYRDAHRYTGSFPVSGDGTHAVHGLALDTAGNAISTLVTLRIDTTLPVTRYVLTGTYNATTGWYVSPVTVTLSATDTPSGPAGTTYSTNGTDFVAYSSPLYVTTQNETTVHYRTTDAAGNVEPVRNVTFRLDTVAPVLATPDFDGLAGLDGWYRGPVLATLAATDATSGISRLASRVDGAAARAYTGPVTIAGEGVHTFSANATDGAGLRTGIDILTLRIDSLAPSLSIGTNGPTGTTAGVFIGNVTVNITATDSGSGVRNVTYRVNGGDWQVHTSRTANFTVAFEPGTTTVDYLAYDAAGNAAPLQTLSIPMALPPANAAVSFDGPSGTNGWFRGPVTVTIDGSGDSVEYSINGSSILTPYTGPFVVEADGLHSLTYRVTSAAGSSPLTTTQLRIDSTPPTLNHLIVGLPGLTPWYTTPVAIVVMATDAGAGIVNTRYAVNGANHSAYTTPFVVADDGVHSVRLNATDAAGNEAIVVVPISIDATAPVVDVLDRHETMRQFAPATVRVTVTDPYVTEVVLKATRADGSSPPIRASATAEPGVFTATVGPFRTPGARVYYAEARDAAGNRGVSTPVPVLIVDGQPPQVSIDAPAPGLVTGTGTLAITATDRDGSLAGVVTAVRVEFVNATDPTVRHGPFNAAAGVGSTFSYAWNTADLTNGEWIANVIAVDQQNNTANATRVYRVANAPTLSYHAELPPADATIGIPGPASEIKVSIGINGTTAPFDATLYYFVGDADEVEVPLGGDGNFTLGTFPAGTLIEYAIEIGDAAGVVGRYPSFGFEDIAIQQPADPRSWTEGTLTGGGTAFAAEGEEPHYWVKIDEAGFEGRGQAAKFTFFLNRTFAGEAAAYIVDFDVDLDGIADYNLTVEHAADNTLTTAWNRNFTLGALPLGPLVGATLPTVTPRTLAGETDPRVLDIVTTKRDIRDAIGMNPARANITYRAIGSFDITSPVTIDITPPVVSASAPATVRDIDSIPVTATFADANFQGAALYYSFNGGTTTRAPGGPASSDTSFTWTLPATGAAGTLTYFVTATDTRSNSATTAAQAVVVTSTALPTGSIVAPTQVDEASLVGFSISGLSASATTFDWTFLSGTTVLATATGQSVSYSFATPDSVSAQLVISDSFGNNITTTHAITVLDVLPPEVSIASPANGAFSMTGPTIAVNAADTATLQLVEVSFDDGVTWLPMAAGTAAGAFTAAFPSDLVPAAGSTRTFLVQTRATDAVGHESAADTISFTIDRTPPTPLLAVAPITGLANAALAFSAAGSLDDTGTDLAYVWSFGDGTTATGANPTKTFTTAGTFPVTLAVTDLAGNTATATGSIVITAPATGGGGIGGGGGGALPAPTPTPAPTPAPLPPLPLPNGAASNTTMELARQVTGLALPQPFSVNNTADGQLVFVDPNGELAQLRPVTTLGGNALFVVSKVGEPGAAFLWDAGTNQLIEVHNPVPAAAPMVDLSDANQSFVRVTVDKADWIYFEIEDPDPTLPLAFVRAGDGRVLSADRVWRVDGKIAVLDDPDTTYDLVFMTSGGPETPPVDTNCPPNCPPDEGEDDTNCPPSCPPRISLPDPEVGADKLLRVVPGILQGVVTRVEYFIDGVKVGESTTAPFGLEFDTSSLGAGEHTLRIVAYDATGENHEQQSTFTTQSTDGSGSDTGGDGEGGSGLIVWIILAILAIAGAAAFVISRRKK